jgi:hypothetical protein
LNEAKKNSKYDFPNNLFFVPVPTLKQKQFSSLNCPVPPFPIENKFLLRTEKKDKRSRKPALNSVGFFYSPKFNTDASFLSDKRL